MKKKAIHRKNECEADSWIATPFQVQNEAKNQSMLHSTGQKRRKGRNSGSNIHPNLFTCVPRQLICGLTWMLPEDFNHDHATCQKIFSHRVVFKIYNVYEDIVGLQTVASRYSKGWYIIHLWEHLFIDTFVHGIMWQWL